MLRISIDPMQSVSPKFILFSAPKTKEPCPMIMTPINSRCPQQATFTLTLPNPGKSNKLQQHNRTSPIRQQNPDPAQQHASAQPITQQAAQVADNQLSKQAALSPLLPPRVLTVSSSGDSCEVTEGFCRAYCSVGWLHSGASFSGVTEHGR